MSLCHCKRCTSSLVITNFQLLPGKRSSTTALVKSRIFQKTIFTTYRLQELTASFSLSILFLKYLYTPWIRWILTTLPRKEGTWEILEIQKKKEILLFKKITYYFTFYFFKILFLFLFLSYFSFRINHRNNISFYIFKFQRVLNLKLLFSIFM